MEPVFVVVGADSSEWRLFQFPNINHNPTQTQNDYDYDYDYDYETKNDFQMWKSGFIPVSAHSTDAPRPVKTDPSIDTFENPVIEVLVLNFLLTQRRKAAKVKNYDRGGGDFSSLLGLS